MILNISRCYSVSSYGSRSPIKFIYSLNNNIQLELETDIKELNITSYNLNFNQHIENSISKALKFL
jgi:hypothetical protein